jgi:hypothetical protein
LAEIRVPAGRETGSQNTLKLPTAEDDNPPQFRFATSTTSEDEAPTAISSNPAEFTAFAAPALATRTLNIVTRPDVEAITSV